MDVQVQARSEVNGLSYYDTIKEAMEAHEKDPTIWKISFDSQTGERVRLVFDNAEESWIYEPILFNVEDQE